MLQRLMFQVFCPHPLMTYRSSFIWLHLEPPSLIIHSPSDIRYWWCSNTDQTTVLCLVSQSCLTLCDPMDCSPPGSSVHGDSPGKDTGVGCHALLQGIFPAQGSNPGLPHCKWILYSLSYQGSPDHRRI